MAHAKPLVQLPRPREEPGGSWVATVAGLAGFILLGYLVFLAFAGGVFRDAGVAVLGVAVIAGVASFFSPCAFPFLPTYLSVRALAGRDTARGKLVGGAAEGAVAGLGVIAFNAILGSVVGVVGVGFAASLALLSPTPSPIAVAVRLIVAGALIALGLLQVLGRGFHARVVARIGGAFQRLVNRGRGGPAMFLYGFSYTAIGIGCTGPFLASVILVGLAAGGFGPALVAFLVFSVTMAALMVAVSLLASTGLERTRTLVARAPKVRRVAGGVLVVFGTLLAAFTVNPSLLRPLFP